jgi:hypothetical protein
MDGFDVPVDEPHGQSASAFCLGDLEIGTDCDLPRIVDNFRGFAEKTWERDLRDLQLKDRLVTLPPMP